MRSLPAGHRVFGVKCSNKTAGSGRAKMRQKDGKGSFALRKLRPPLWAKSFMLGGLVPARDSRRPDPEPVARRAGRPRARGCDLIGRRRPAGP